MLAVGKREYNGPMKIGIGTDAQEKALKKFGCGWVFKPRELRQVIDGKKLPTHMFLRPDDTIVMLQPTLLKLEWFRQIIAAGVDWQVPGHDPVRFKSDEERAAWRKLKPKGQTAKLVKETRGRKASKWPTATPEQVITILAWWHSGKKLSDVVDLVRGLVEADVPAWWVRDLVKKHAGSAKREKY